jgi:hypothetical protein
MPSQQEPKYNHHRHNRPRRYRSRDNAVSMVHRLVSRLAKEVEREILWKVRKAFGIDVELKQKLGLGRICRGCLEKGHDGGLS